MPRQRWLYVVLMWHEKHQRELTLTHIHRSAVGRAQSPASRVSGAPSWASHASSTNLTNESRSEGTFLNKLEQLEQELRSIKQVVNPAAGGQTTWTPPSPRATYSALPEQTPAAGAAATATSLSAGASNGVAPGLRPQPQVPTPHSEPPATASSLGPSQHGSERRAKTGPTESRMLGSLVISGDDVDWYFSKCAYLCPYTTHLIERESNVYVCV
ncbi:hypothetical protein VFPFJ_01211 [Purpureocillium lilacinum]|uniref:Uncharacterized protein n=1 Tax=Purpureocillium lilacinum TaxID=33203 RepID=A0A179HYY1_PURLI|nr:hypothetical protein VFPFJ_01211 [Purpureocillium lilacinum]OAQ95102.1 hypothetical protein VFPFJ_01211 [Purpureocillium lilacinum]